VLREHQQHERELQAAVAPLRDPRVVLAVQAVVVAAVVPRHERADRVIRRVYRALVSWRPRHRPPGRHQLVVQTAPAAEHGRALLLLLPLPLPRLLSSDCRHLMLS